jgi:hypothetical protein
MKSKNPVYQCVIHHRQNPIVTTSIILIRNYYKSLSSMFPKPTSFHLPQRQTYSQHLAFDCYF